MNVENSSKEATLLTVLCLLQKTYLKSYIICLNNNVGCIYKSQIRASLMIGSFYVMSIQVCVN